MKQNSTSNLLSSTDTHYSARVSLRQQLVLALVLLACFPVASQADTASDTVLPCHTIRTAKDPIPTKYGSPINFFGASERPLIEVFCSIDGVSRRVKIGDSAQTTYIYKYGYHKAGGVRKRIEFSGANPSGSWLLGSAEAMVSEPTETEGSVYAYMCQLVQGVWKCGCSDRACVAPKWQMQTYAVPTTQTEGTNLMPDSFSDALKEMHKNISSTEMAKLEKEVEESRIKYSKEVFNVYSALATHVQPGEEVTLSGYDLAPKGGGPVQVMWGTAAKVPATVAADGRSVRVSTPNLSPGKYALQVEREGERTPSRVVVWIRDDSLTIPVITHITPAVGKPGDTFTVFGSGFAREHNDIITTFGTIEDVSSRDGITMSFVFDPFEDAVSVDGNANNTSFTTFVRVMNAGGIIPESVAQFELAL